MLLLLLILAMPLSLLLGGSFDLGRFLAGILGLALVLASYGAIGLFFSSLTLSSWGVSQAGLSYLNGFPPDFFPPPRLGLGAVLLGSDEILKPTFGSGRTRTFFVGL